MRTIPHGAAYGNPAAGGQPDESRTPENLSLRRAKRQFYPCGTVTVPHPARRQPANARTGKCAARRPLRPLAPLHHAHRRGGSALRLYPPPLRTFRRNRPSLSGSQPVAGGHAHPRCLSGDGQLLSAAAATPLPQAVPANPLQYPHRQFRTGIRLGGGAGSRTGLCRPHAPPGAGRTDPALPRTVCGGHSGGLAAAGYAPPTVS